MRILQAGINFTLFLNIYFPYRMNKAKNPGNALRFGLKWMLKAAVAVFILAFIGIAALLIAGYIGASGKISYLPRPVDDSHGQQADTLTKVEIARDNYIVSVDGSGEINIRNSSGKSILTGLTWYSYYDGPGERWGLHVDSVVLKNDSTILVTGRGLSATGVKMRVSVPTGRNRIGIDITSHYNSDVLVAREALLARFETGVREIYKKNSEMDTSSFDYEYWLGRGGVRFGDGDRSVIIYHTMGISSLQLDPAGKRLFINLDYSPDHPFFNIPYQKEGGGKWNDLSEASFRDGSERRNSFTLWLGKGHGEIPRLMLVPDGYLAGYVFTEHADGGTIRTHRAAYFGSEDITDISDARGGFAGYGIPVTKSIFFPDIDTAGINQTKPDSVQFMTLGFMDQLYRTGNYDICLHGVRWDGKDIERSVRTMKESFDTKTWIDHGMFSGTRHRQSFVCDGLTEGSEYYMADLWEKYGTRYFWNASVEEFSKIPVWKDIQGLKFYKASVDLWRWSFSAEELHELGLPKALMQLKSRLRRKGEMNSLKPGRGNAFQTPLYWQHPTRTSDFYSWTTDYVSKFSQNDEELRKEEENLEKLVADRGIFINHGYYVRNDVQDGVLVDSAGRITASPYFNRTLSIMSRMMARGDLYITTIRNLLDYWMLTGRITFDYNPDGSITINNRNEKPVHGLSMAIKAETVRIDGVEPKLRRVGTDIIFWLDLPAGKSVKLYAE